MMDKVISGISKALTVSVVNGFHFYGSIDTVNQSIHSRSRFLGGKCHSHRDCLLAHP